MDRLQGTTDTRYHPNDYLDLARGYFRHLGRIVTILVSWVINYMILDT